MEPEQPPHNHQDTDMADADMQVEDHFDNGGDDDEYDNTPAFVGEGDAVEVQVDDDNAPMEDDDDDEDDVQDDGDDDFEEEEVVDMAKATISSHSDPVYAVACTLNTAGPNTGSNQQSLLLRIVSGGGDDKAFWHEIALSNSSSTPTPTSTTQFQVQTSPLEHLHTFKDSVSAIADNSPFIAFDATKPPNPQWMAVGALDGSIVLYGPNNQVQLLEGPTSDIEFLCWHPKGGNVVLAGSSDATLWMYHTGLKKCLQVFVGHEDSVTCGCFSADGKVAVSGSADGTVRIWAPKTGKSKHVFRFVDNSSGSAGGGPPPALTCMVTHGGPDHQLVMVGSEDGQAHICHIAKKKHVASLRHYDPTTNVNVIHNNNNNPQGNNDDGDDDEEEVLLPSGVEAVGFCKSNPNWCATGGMDGVLKIWDLANQGQVRHTCHQADANTTKNGAGNGITKLEWHPTLPLVITSNCRGRIHLWDARNGQLLETLTGHRDVINDMSIVFVPSAAPAAPATAAAAGHALIVTGSDDHTVRVFDLDIDAALAKAPQQILA